MTIIISATSRPIAILGALLSLRHFLRVTRSGERTRLACRHWLSGQCELLLCPRTGISALALWISIVVIPEGFGEGAETNTRGRMCSPEQFSAHLRARW